MSNLWQLQAMGFLRYPIFRHLSRSMRLGILPAMSRAHTAVPLSSLEQKAAVLGATCSRTRSAEPALVLLLGLSLHWFRNGFSGR